MSPTPISTSTPTSTVVTYNLLGRYCPEATGLSASLIYMDGPTTALSLNCCPEFVFDECNNDIVHVTVGPWAQITPPPNVAFGSFDLQILSSDPQPSEPQWAQNAYSLHCELASTTVPVICEQQVGPLSEAPATYPASAYNDPSFGGFSVVQVPITITAGLEKLPTATALSSSGAAGLSPSFGNGMLGLSLLLVALFMR